jgi:1,4-alpha-glucan branching enzyme/maltooligosyltrehalose trehalohydrolase
MPFGATVGNDAVTFSLWAPAAQRVELRLLTRAGGERLFPLERRDAGWFGLSTSAARPGDRYLYVIDGGAAVPDPASRFQPADVHGPSELIDPEAFDWPDADWHGRPWEEIVTYELHVGTFTAAGTYAAAREKLGYLADLGVTAIELMPLAEAPGARNWGYDGVYPFAPEARYGSPEDLKAFIAEAQRQKLAVFLDVVYNHFGPEGNYLSLYAPDFFTDRYRTPWGAAINFDGPESAVVRSFFVHNALYWIEEFNVDGLRLDAVQAIKDAGAKHILVEIADRVAAVARPTTTHLVLENDDNAAGLLARDASGRLRHYAAQWDDDLHHALHVLLTGEAQGYYSDYADDSAGHLGRALVEGFAYQGEISRHRKGRRRGAPSAHLPAAAFVSFLQNHDQVGNRFRGDRIASIAPAAAAKAAAAIVLLSPAPPLLFMGEEWGSRQPFHFFCDFEPALQEKVRAGRRDEFAAFLATDRAAPPPDATSPEAFRQSVLRWEDVDIPSHAEWLRFYRTLLDLRHRYIMPRAAGARGLDWQIVGDRRRVIRARWRLGDGSSLQLLANLDSQPASGIAEDTTGEEIFSTAASSSSERSGLPPWSVAWRCAASLDR